MTDIPNRCISARDNGKILCIAFRPDGRHVVTGQDSGYIRQWNVENGEEFSPLSMKSSSNIYAIATSMDGRWIVSGDGGKLVIVWNAVTHQKAIQVSEHKQSVYAVDVSSDSTRMASGSGDFTVRIFDIVSGTRVAPKLSHTERVASVKFSPDGSQIATATYQQGLVSIFDSRSGNKLSGISVPQIVNTVAQVTAKVAPVTLLAWSSDGGQLFVGSSDKVTTFDTSTFYRSEWQRPRANNPAIVAHGRFIASCAVRSILFWDYSSRKEIGSIETSRFSTASFDWISISQDGRYLVCGDSGVINVYILASRLPQAYFNVHQPISRIQLIQVSSAVLESWKGGNWKETQSILSTEIARQHASPSHHTLAARSLIRSHLREWGAAIEDAEQSLKIKQSPIGQIAKCIAFIGVGKQEAALDDYDFVFHGADSNDSMLLLVIKSILMFMCGKRTQAISRLRDLITASDQDDYSLVLVNMYLKQGDYGNAVKTLELAQESSMSNPLLTVSFIFNWDFDSLAATTWLAQCKNLYSSGCIKELGETLEKMVSPLAQDEKESAHGLILQELVTRTGEVTLLEWTGQSSACNSCLPCSPIVYSNPPFVPPYLEEDDLMKRTDELRSVISSDDVMMTYGRVTRLQPVRFADFHLHLSCIVFSVTSLEREQENVYRAKTIELGDVQFTTADSLPLKHPRRLVFADLRIHSLQKPHGGAVSWDDTASSDAESVLEPGTTAVTNAGIVHVPIIEEVPSQVPSSSDASTQALELIAHLGQRFSALLLLQQPEGVYRRVAADHEIIINGMGNNVPKDLRVEVLEIL